MDFFRDSFSGLPTLRTKRLTLRKLRMSDDRDIFAYARDREVAKHVLWEAHRSLRDTRAMLRGALRQYRAGDPATYAIVRSEDGRVIGTIGFMWINTEHRSAEVGYSLARDCWNQGYCSEALRAVIDYGFNELHLNRIEAQHETDNPASGRVMEKCGMRCEGTLRQRVLNKGKYADVRLYAILRTDKRE